MLKEKISDVIAGLSPNLKETLGGNLEREITTLKKASGNVDDEDDEAHSSRQALCCETIAEVKAGRKVEVIIINSTDLVFKAASTYWSQPP